MKKAIPLLSLILSSYYLSAQDQLFKKDNAKLQVKVIEVGTDEIKYKLFENLNGPTYVLNKSEVSLIIYQNGNHEVITSDKQIDAPAPAPMTNGNNPYSRANTYKSDSLQYFKYSQSVSLNFLNFINNEFGFIYQREIYKKNYNVVVPFSIGLSKPSLTESVYDLNNNNSYVDLNRKLFEIGLGINYYASLKYPVNYYIGPVIKMMQYEATQYLNYNGPGSYGGINQTSTLNRYTASITNGVMIRTKTRLVINFFASFGFKYDVMSDLLLDPITKKEVDPIGTPVQFYFWGGTSVGFCF